MDPKFEVAYHDLEASHWWFRARRKMVVSLLPIDSGFRYLDVGCSSGRLMQQLIERGVSVNNVFGLDVSQEAAVRCRSMGLNVCVSDAATPAFAEGAFDVIVASDCLEHVQLDRQALRRWADLLKPTGVMVVFVPAFMTLWSQHDEINHHHRRYRGDQLCELANEAGLEVTIRGYWNTALFFPIAAVRVIGRFLKRSNSTNGDLALPPRFINEALFSLLRLEEPISRRGLFPVGVSTFFYARKR